MNKILHLNYYMAVYSRKQNYCKTLFGYLLHSKCLIPARIKDVSGTSGCKDKAGHAFFSIQVVTLVVICPGSERTNHHII